MLPYTDNYRNLKIMGSWRTFAVALVLSAAFAPMVSAAGFSAPAERVTGKRILALFPMPSRSHHIFYAALLKALLERGNHVTLVTSISPEFNHPNQSVINVENPLGRVRLNPRNNSDTFSTLGVGFVRQQLLLWEIGLSLSYATLTKAEVLALKGVKHDLVMTEAFFFQEALLSFADHYKVPSIALNPFGSNLWLNDLTGGAINPSYVPNALLWMTDHMTFYERVINTYYCLFELVGYYYWYYDKQAALLKQAFPDAPPLKHLIGNISLTMVNNHAALSYPIPLSPTVLEVGGLHIAPGKPLPADLKKWLDASPDGFVYFSMGSTLLASDMPREKINVFLNVFKMLKQKVLIRWDAKIPQNALPNCRFEPWLPQQTVLAHPNTRIFVTHGGLLSMQESVYHSVPVVVIPIFGDQFMNARLAVNRGFGFEVSYKKLSKASLGAAVNEVLHNPSYREKAQSSSVLFRSQPQPPLEKALTYIDLLFKWGNTDHLRPASLDLRWYQLILLDVYAVNVLGLYIVWLAIRDFKQFLKIFVHLCWFLMLGILFVLLLLKDFLWFLWSVKLTIVYTAMALLVKILFWSQVSRFIFLRSLWHTRIGGWPGRSNVTNPPEVLRT